MSRGYGFVDAGPAGQVFAVTSDYADIARNHCAATMMTNLMLQRYGRAPMCGDRRALFQRIHHFLGNGPVLRIVGKANRYLAQEGISSRCRQWNRHLLEASPERLLRVARYELLAGRPCALLVAAAPFRWHWVLAISMQEERDGAMSLLIADGWHARRIYQYIPDHGSRLMAVATVQG